MSDNLALVDTNVLVYALYRETEQHECCRALRRIYTFDHADFEAFSEIEVVTPS